MSRLSKLERHVIRQAVRRTGAVTRHELMEMHPQEMQIALAEMRKRKFTDDINTNCWYHPKAI